jgi:hypothetical protein
MGLYIPFLSSGTLARLTLWLHTVLDGPCTLGSYESPVLGHNEGKFGSTTW